VNPAGNSLDEHYHNILDVDNWQIDPKAQYFHFC
jgi:phosphoserine aminotransferase